ncbi:MAG: hypothetical protein WBD20_03025 [Pirellulaceae bacterium]
MATNAGGQVDLQVDANAFCGEVAFHAQADLREPDVHATWSTQGSGCDLRQVTQIVQPSLDAGAIAAWKGQAPSKHEANFI